MKIISRKEAISKGLKRYYTGKPCLRGHLSERWAVAGRCLTCHYEDSPLKNIPKPTDEEKKEKSKARAKRWYAKNRQLTIERAAKWKAENKERYRELSSAKQKEWRLSTEGRLTAFMCQCIRRTMKNKKDRTEKVIGYKKTDLMSHLEKQFKAGMSWDNYGEWHIDHITPIKALLKNGVTDPKIVNCLSNLRPIWAKENLSKGSKVEFLL